MNTTLVGIDAMCARLMDSEEHAVESAIPEVAEDAVELIRQMFSEITRLKEANRNLVSVSDETTGIPRFPLMNGGKNPENYTAEASRTGDAGIYNEVRIGVFKESDNVCLADVLVGLNDAGEPRILVTADGNGDNEAAFVIYPLRPAEEALSSWAKEPSAPSTPFVMPVMTEEAMNTGTVYPGRSS